MIPTASPSVRSLKRDLLRGIPAPWRDDLTAHIAGAVAASGVKVVVLDDDPTGTQTVHDLPVLADRAPGLLREEFSRPNPACFILTNSRSLPPDDAARLIRNLATNIRAASRESKRGVCVISRGDSTLRGHFPLETDVLNEVLGPFDGTLLVPSFEAGRRWTLGDVHYLESDELMIPVAETEFARDASFGYLNSNLRHWVEEKSLGRIKAGEVDSLGIEEIRQGGPDAVCERLMNLEPGSVCVVNAADIRDLQAVVAGALEAEARGRRLLYRTAASFAALRCGVTPRGLIHARELNLEGDAGGILVVGSHVPTTSAQLARLIALGRTVNVEIDVRMLEQPDSREAAVAGAVRVLDQAVKDRKDAVLYTSRERRVANDTTGNLALGRTISIALAEIIRRISVRPRFLVGKGGVTSSDVATHGLGLKRAWVLGQILSGVPVWRLDECDRWSGLVYVPFPGNVGGPDALVDLLEVFRPAQGA